MAQSLTSARRSELRADAHKLKPVVLIGDKGLTESIFAEIERALAAHELIKVKAGTDDRLAREAWMAAICERLQAQAVQQIGKVLVLYRPNPEKHIAKPAARIRTPKPKRLPRERAAPEPRTQVRTKAGKKPALWTKKPREPGATGTSRRRSPAPSPRPGSGPRRRPRSTSR